MGLVTEKAKEELVRVARKMAAGGLVVGTWGNLSCLVPRDGVVCITPSGMPYDVMQPEDVVVLDPEGRVVEGEHRPSTEWPLHLAVYRARPDAGAVIHTHSLWCSVLAVVRRGIPPIVEDMAQVLGGGVEVAEYAPPGTPELAARTVAALGKANAALLANHGAVALGRSLAEAYVAARVLEKSAQIYVLACLLGGAAALEAAEVEELRRQYLTSYGPGPAHRWPCGGPDPAGGACRA
ncbi:MAG: class II aldolase/adducin family protein [Firmicutes bacterium]|nr:class II aldolase/adducin family protein [Bacillota bacterium]